MISTVVYDADGTTVYDDLATARAADGTTWVHASAVTGAEFDRIADAFDLHALAVEDVRNDVRAKTELFDEYVFVLIETVALARGETSFEEAVTTTPVGIFVGDDWIVSVSPADVPVVGRVHEAVTAGDARLRRRSADFTA